MQGQNAVVVANLIVVRDRLIRLGFRVVDSGRLILICISWILFILSRLICNLGVIKTIHTPLFRLFA